MFRWHPIALSLAFVVVPVVALSACTDDADGGISDATLPDAEVTDGTADGSGDSAPADSAEDTGVADDTSAPADTTPADTTPADTTPADTTPADTAVEDAPGDTASDSAGDGDTVVPACNVDADCVALGLIIQPNECNVPVCVEGQCTTGPRDCADDDPCTLDACDPRGGCVNALMTLDVGASRYTYCPDALAETDAATACAAHDQVLAVIDDEGDPNALERLLLDNGATDAWVSPSSIITCLVPKRVVPLLCKTLQDVEGDTCAGIKDCIDAFPFLCEQRCDDADPCTEDVMQADGSCTALNGGCDDGNSCTVDSCEVGVGCKNELSGAICADANPCTTDLCDPLDGCSNKPVRQPWDATHELLECPGLVTWDASRNACAVNGGTLAWATTDTQRGALVTFTSKPNVTPALWAPLQQVGGGANPWTWTDGVGSGDPPWCAGEPNEAAAPEDCGDFVTGTNCTDDVGCSALRSFACSIDTSIP